MKTLKIALSVLMALCVCALVAGCMNNDTAAPQATNGHFAPETTAAITQPPVAFDWVTGSGTIEGNVNRISEVSDCRIVVITQPIRLRQGCCWGAIRYATHIRAT